MTIYIAPEYPKPVVEIIEKIHSLQKNEKIEIRRMMKNMNLNMNHKNAIFLEVDFQKRGISIPIKKQAAEGYKTIVCRCVDGSIDRFEFIMTVFRVWPYIIEKTVSKNDEPLFSFKYGGSRLSKAKI